MAKQTLEEMSWFEKMDLVRKVSKYPAITVMVFFRRRIGFRMMNPTWLLVLTISMIVLPALFGPAARPFGFFMVAYAFAMLALGLFQRWQRWNELCRGVRWHSYSPGISFLEAVPWPPFLKSFRRVNRFVDPAVVALVGLLTTGLLSHGLGLWILFSALFLYVYEQDLFEKSLAHDLDILDGMISADVQTETVKFFEGKQPEQKCLALADTMGVPTGLAPDIEKQVAILKAKRAKAADNLAKGVSGAPA